jgi:transcriptional regulator with XRE-family HTH domain
MPEILAENCYERKQHIAKHFAYRAGMRKTSARQVLVKNLSRLRDASLSLKTQTQIAEKSGVSQRSVSNLLNCDKPETNAPTLDTIEDVARAYGLEAWQLLLDREAVGERLYEVLMRPDREAEEQVHIPAVAEIRRQRATPVRLVTPERKKP